MEVIITCDVERFSKLVNQINTYCDLFANFDKITMFNKSILNLVYTNHVKVPLTLEYLKSLPEDLDIKFLPSARECLKNVITGKLSLIPTEVIVSRDRKILSNVEYPYYYTSVVSDNGMHIESAMTCDFGSLDSKKTNRPNMTNRVFKVKLSTFSIGKMKSYSNRIQYSYQGGDTQIWFGDNIIFKMYSDARVWEHEISILKLGHDFFPVLIDSWYHGHEHFVVMKNCGQSLGKLYFVESLVPEEIKIKQNEVYVKIRKAGLVPLVFHIFNYLINDENQLTMIDMEMILWEDDYNAIIHNYKRYTPKMNESLYHSYRKMY